MKKHRPILFSTAMVQAILEGRKTQTRRIIKESFNGCWTNGGPHPCPNPPVVFYPGEIIPSPIEGEEAIIIHSEKVEAIFHCSTLDSVAKCPYGKPGDLLWVRETWANLVAGYEGLPIGYGMDGVIEDPVIVFKASTPEDVVSWKWKPSIHMPRQAARIFLEITSIRVERLQDISEEDCKAEGITEVNGMYHHAFHALWDSINVDRASWESNPWVWVITFQKTEAPTHSLIHSFTH